MDEENEKYYAELVEEVEEYREEYGDRKIEKLKKLLKEDKRKFIKYYKSVSGATNWDIPETIRDELNLKVTNKWH